MIQIPCATDDKVMLQRLKEIVAERGIGLIVETGTHLGGSTLEFTRMLSNGIVVGVDNNPVYLKMTQERLSAEGAHNHLLCLGNSPHVLQILMPVLPYSTLFFLDAHWGAYWPLLDELSVIAPGKGVIVLHDIEVPGHPELGWDQYGGQKLDYDYVKGLLYKWSPVHRVEYNQRAECGHPRGVAYVYPS